MDRIKNILNKHSLANACSHPPSSPIENNCTRVDTGIVYPIVSLGLFLMMMVIFSSVFHVGLSSFVNLSIFLFTFSTIMILIISSSYRAFKSYHERDRYY